MSQPTYRIAQRLHERRATKGLETYGRHLDADSKGCMLAHALEEAADQVNYLLAEIQRRKIVLEKLNELSKEMHAELAIGWAYKLEKLYDLLGGKSAIAQYDEILGGGTIAVNATVDPLSDPVISTLHKFATTELPQIETITTSGSLPTDPRDEALRVATEALEDIVGINYSAAYLPPHEPNAARAIEIARGALAAIRAAGGAR